MSNSAKPQNTRVPLMYVYIAISLLAFVSVAFSAWGATVALFAGLLYVSGCFAGYAAAHDRNA